MLPPISGSNFVLKAVCIAARVGESGEPKFTIMAREKTDNGESQSIIDGGSETVVGVDTNIPQSFAHCMLFLPTVPGLHLYLQRPTRR